MVMYYGGVQRNMVKFGDVAVHSAGSGPPVVLLHANGGSHHDFDALIDSLAMHAAAANGVRECRWPPSCVVYKPSHGSISRSRVRQVWKPWQRRLDTFLADHVGEDIAYRLRTLLDYPRRKVRGVEALLGPSFERNLVKPARRWALGERQTPSQPDNWGLADATLEQRTLCRASWE